MVAPKSRLRDSPVVDDAESTAIRAIMPAPPARIVLDHRPAASTAYPSTFAAAASQVVGAQNRSSGTYMARGRFPTWKPASDLLCLWWAQQGSNL